MLKKNDIITLTITDITHECSGIGKHDGLAIFVPLTAVGDIIKAKITKVNKNFAFGIIEEILSPSSTREVNTCPVYNRCGGCSFRHITYTEELRIKENWVRENMRRIGGFTDLEVLPIIPSPSTNGYRNKVQYPLSMVNGKICAGFYAQRTHQVIPYTSCLLQHSDFEIVTTEVLSFLNENNITYYNELTHSGLIRHIYLRRGAISGEMMLCLVATSYNIPNINNLTDRLLALELNSKLVSIVINKNNANTNVILGNHCKIVYGKDGITDVMCDNTIDIATLAFYQINHPAAELLYNKAAEILNLKGTEKIVELYCGAGTITLSLAHKAKEIIAVEIISEAIENAKLNAKINNISNVEFICDDAQGTATKLANKGIKPDIVVVDPPRKGCDMEVLYAIGKMHPEKILYISCNSATLARDCAELWKMGFKISAVQAVDMFPRTGHVETCVLLSHKNL